MAAKARHGYEREAGGSAQDTVSIFGSRRQYRQGIATRAGLISNICGGSRYWQGATRISICGRQDGCGAILGPGDACGTCRANICEGGRGAQGIAARRAHRINICEGGEAHMSVPLYQGQGGQYICAR